MGFLGLSSSARWHRKIETTAARREPSALVQYPTDEYFPWIQLQMHTDSYLSKKSKLSQQEREVEVVTLIREHASKDIAMAATVHILSITTIRELLDSFLATEIENPSKSGTSSYFRIFSATRTVRPEAVTDVELHCWQVLARLSTSGDGSRSDPTYELLQLLAEEGVSSHPLLYNYIEESALDSWRTFARSLAMLKDESKWERAYTETRWLESLEKTLNSKASYGHISEMLQKDFPMWKTWAAWKPNLNRIQLWSRLTIKEQSDLRHLLALEGPDFASGSAITFSKGAKTVESVVRLNELRIELKDGATHNLRDLLHRLVQVTESTCLIGRPTANLLSHVCVGKTVDDEAIEFLESFIFEQDPSIESVAMRLLSESHVSDIEKINVVKALLPFLGSSHGARARNYLIPGLIRTVTALLENFQSQLCAQHSDSESWTRILTMLASFGNLLRHQPWLRPLLDPGTQELLTNWPRQVDAMSLGVVRASASANGHALLVIAIKEYCLHRLVAPRDIDTSACNIVESLKTLFQQAHDRDRRELALTLSSMSYSSMDVSKMILQYHCLSDIPDLPADFVHSLLSILQSYKKDGQSSAQACVEMARLLVSGPGSLSLERWRPVLRWMIDQQEVTLIDETLEQLSAVGWLSWIENLCDIFHDVIGDPKSSPLVPQLSLYKWNQRLVEHQRTIAWLDENVAMGPAMHCILTGKDSVADSLIEILQHFKKTAAGRFQPTMKATAAVLRRDGSNAEEVCRALLHLAQTSPDGDAACMHVLDIYQSSRLVAEAVLTGYLNEWALEATNQEALRSLAIVLGFSQTNQRMVPESALEAATLFFDEQVAELLAEAERLNGLRIALSAVDPEGTSAQLALLNFEAPTMADDALMMLPPTLVDVVEQVGEREVELQFPITHLSALHRAAMGLGEAQSLMIRIVLGDSSLPTGFCIHHGNEIEHAVHFPWVMLHEAEAPIEHFCGTHPSRAKFSLSRALFRHLQEGTMSLEGIHTFVTGAINNIASICIACGSAHGTRLRRSTPCTLAVCQGIFNRSELEVRLSEMQHDPAVVDLLLTMVHAAANTGNLVLLPGCPLGEVAAVQQVIDGILPLSLLETVNQASNILENFTNQTKAFLSWLCCSYRGYLVSATEQLRIPHVPGVHQFVLANAAPELEVAFAAHRTASPQASSRVLFHGTTLDRLYSILCLGLRVCSDDPTLMRHGAAHGRGIYMADEPRTAWSYSISSRAVTKNSWAHSPFNACRVLLGCEYVGASAKICGGVYVIQDPSMLMLRYIWLLPSTCVAPLAVHVRPAMMSGFALLR